MKRLPSRQVRARLEAIPVLRALPRRCRTLATSSVTLVYRPRGTTVVHGGEIGWALFVVETGLVAALIRAPGGRSSAIALLGPGEVVGELALLEGFPQPSDVIAVRDTILLAIPAEVLREEVRTCAAAARALAQLLALRLLDATESAEDLLGRGEVRVAKRLCQLRRISDRGSAREDSSPRVDDPPSQEDLAALTGLARETVNRIVRSSVDLSTLAGRDLRPQATAGSKN
jgi:CRP/FNR family transcriptional regulator, cyclic AMP receptor protein